MSTVPVRPHRFTSTASLLLAAVVLFAACNDDPLRPKLDDLANGESIWSASGHTDAYVITQTRECFCATGGTAFAVTVVRDTIVGVRNLLTGDEVPAVERSYYRTVNELFREVRRGLAAGTLREVEYDRTRGFPTTVSLDPVRNAIDDEIVYRTGYVGAAAAGAMR